MFAPIEHPVICECDTNHPVALAAHDAVASAACPACGVINYASRYERMDIGLSEVCNLSCLMCRRPQEKEFMPRKRVLSYFREARRIGVKTLSFSGGEPFVHPDFRDLIHDAIALGFEVELVTNGTLVKASDIALLEKLKCVTVSIDGPQTIHDRIRGMEGAWKKSMATIELMSRAKVKWGTNTVIQNANATKLLQTWREIRAVGRPSYVAFTHVEVVPETLHLLPPDAQTGESTRQLHQIWLECESNGIHFNDAPMVGEHYEMFKNKARRYRPFQGCPIPQTFLGISNYGIFPCWHQGRHIPHSESLITALESDLCRSIVLEGQQRRCVGCNAANYSWNKEWVAGIIAAHEAADWVEGVVYLSSLERVKGSLSSGKRTLPIIERNSK